MADLKSKRLICVKGGLFVILGCLSAGYILLLHPSWRLAAMGAITIWAFCRAYYFAFYVITHYVDDTFRYAGLLDFLHQAWGRCRRSKS